MSVIKSALEAIDGSTLSPELRNKCINYLRAHKDEADFIVRAWKLTKPVNPPEVSAIDTCLLEMIKPTKAITSQDEFKTQVIRSAYKNYKYKVIGTTQKQKFIFITGGSGIGKTRAGYETSRIKDMSKYSTIITDPDFIQAITDPIYLYLNLSNGCKFNYHLDSNSQQEEVSLGARVALSSGMYSGLNKEPFTSLDEIIKGGFQNQLHFERVVKDLIKVSKKKVPLIIIHIDEFQEYITQFDIRTSSNSGGNYLKSMLATIGAYMQNYTDCTILPICTSTSDRGIDFMKTGYGNTQIILKPLTLSCCKKIIEEYYRPDSPQVKLLSDRSFQIAISDTGFIPKDLGYLLDNVSEGSTDFATQCYLEISALNRTDLQDPRDMHYLCSKAIVHTPVMLSTLLPSGQSIDQIRIKGYIYLVPLSSGGGSSNVSEVPTFRIYMSFYNLKSFNMKSTPQCFPDGILLLPTSILPWFWQHFEKLYPYVQVCLFESVPRSIELVFRGVDGLDNLGGGNVTKYPKLVIEEQNQSEAWLSYTHSNVGHKLQDCNNIVICHQNEIIDHKFAFMLNGKTVFVFVQIKHSKPDVLDPNLDDAYGLLLGAQKLFHEVDDEVKQAKINNWASIYLLVTNRKTVNKDLIDGFNERKGKWNLDNKHHLAIVSMENFEKFFGDTISNRGLIVTDGLPFDKMEDLEFYSSQPN
eukprot:gene12016-14050_t